MADISAVIVSYNAARFLEDNIASLLRQVEPFQQIIVVDNHSGDGSAAVLDRFSQVQALKLEENIGYAAAANRGIAASRAGVVLVANADTIFPPDFTCRILERLRQDPAAGMLVPLLLRFDRETVDSAGQVRSLALYPREIGYNRRLRDVAPRAGEVFSACGAATIFTRTALERLRVEGEIYDEDFFMFWEDFDIGWRARLFGIQVLFCPELLAYHFRSGTLERNWRARLSLALSRPAGLRLHLVKNRYLCLIKNFRWRRDGWRLPAMILKDMIWVGALTIASPKNIMALLRSGQIFRRSWRKRRWIIDHE